MKLCVDMHIFIDMIDEILYNIVKQAIKWTNLVLNFIFEKNKH